VAFTATRWGQLLKEKKMPPGEKSMTAADCYRFVLSNPAIDVCMTELRPRSRCARTSPSSTAGMSEDELARVRRIGDYVHGPKRR